MPELNNKQMRMLSRFDRKTIYIIFSGLLLVLLPMLAALAGEPYLVSLFSRILIYALAAASLDLILGYGGLVSLGHAAFFGIGAYAVGILAHHDFEQTVLISWPMTLPGSDSGLIVWPVAFLVSALLATIIGALSLRTSGMHFIMITLAFAQMLFFFFVSLEGYGGDDGLTLFSRNTLPGLDLNDDVHFYYVCLALLSVFLFLAGRLVESRFGMVIRGCREGEKRLMHWTRSAIILVMVLLGGSGTLYGPVLGAAAFLLLEEVLSIYTEHWMVYFGPVMILVVLFARHGLFGILVGKEKRHG